MRYLIFALMLTLVGCETNPGRFEGTIVNGVHYVNSDSNYIVVYSEKYGNIKMYDVPLSLFKQLQINEKVIVGCSDLKGFFGPTDCNILGVKND